MSLVYSSLIILYMKMHDELYFTKVIIEKLTKYYLLLNSI